jgi:hypothetical protein
MKMDFDLKELPLEDFSNVKQEFISIEKILEL